MSWLAVGAMIAAAALGGAGTCSPHRLHTPASESAAVREQPDDVRSTKPAFVLEPESRVELAGGATIGAWKCESNRVQGAIAPDADVDAIVAVFDRLRRGIDQNDETANDSITIPEDYDFATQVRVPISSFDCGDPRMERDMFEALKSNAHPTIAYQLTAVENIRAVREVQEDEQKDEQAVQADPVLRFMTRGELLLAGVTREIEMDVVVRRIDDERWSLIGRKQLKMSDFDVTPPSAFLGLIRAHDTVEVTFNLVAARPEAEQP